MGVADLRVDVRVPRLWLVGAIIIGMSPTVGGCVVMEEKYNAEKARSLNFQRLLAQEEKRTAELDSEVKRTKLELAEFEARNRELSGQVQVAREQMGRLQEEAEAIREATLLERKALEDMRRKGHSPAVKQKKAESAKDSSGEAGENDAVLKGMPTAAETLSCSPRSVMTPAPQATTGNPFWIFFRRCPPIRLVCNRWLSR